MQNSLHSTLIGHWVGIDAKPHWYQASALTTALSLLPIGEEGQQLLPDAVAYVVAEQVVIAVAVADVP